MKDCASTKPTTEAVRDSANDTSPLTDVVSVAVNEDVLSDEILLTICRVERCSLRSNWIAALRSVARLVGCTRDSSQIEASLALLASLLGQLEQYRPAHLPFGHCGPRLESRGWLERDALESVGKQIAGLMWRDTPADEVAGAVQDAVREGLRLGFMEQRPYDAWRPGMPSGSGWRWIVAATPYGVTKARAATEALSDAAGDKPKEKPTESHEPTDVVVSDDPATVSSDLPLAGGPAVELSRPGEPCFINSVEKKPLTDGQYAVVAALLEAGDNGLNKDALEAVRSSARRMLKRLREDADWAAVIRMPGQTNGRYFVRR